MQIQRLEKQLFNDTTRLYAVLDGASAPDLPMRLFETQVPNHCLFKGDIDPDLAYVAPYLVFLPPGHEFTNWVLTEGFGRDWGIFAQSRHSFVEIRRHFRSLVNVYDESGNSMIFRFYDPRVLRKYLPTCTPDEVKEFFGNLETVFAESENGEGLLCFESGEHGLRRTVLN